MMSRPGHFGRPLFSRRLLLFYLVLVAVPAGLFLYLSFHTLRRQWQTMTAPDPVADLRAAAKAIVADSEARTSALATGFFQDPEVAKLTAAIAAADSPRKLVTIRDELRAAAQRHRIVGELFFVRDRTVLLPNISGRRQRPVMTGRSSASAALITEAGRLRQARQGSRALALYQRAYDQARSNEAHAEALDGMAACFRDLKLQDKADASYRKLAEMYGSVLDEGGAPYALRAAFSRSDVSAEELRSLRKQLLDGRWNVSATELEYWRSQLVRRIGPEANAPPTPFLLQFDMARALQARLQQRQPLFRNWISEAGEDRPPQPGDVLAVAFASREQQYQAFLSIVSARNRSVLCGFTADLDWLQKEIFPEVGVGYGFDVVFRGSSAPSSLRFSFERMFPFWELVPTSSVSRRRQMTTDVFVIGGSFVLLCSIGLGVGLVSRYIRQERQLARLREDFVTGVTHELKTPITVVWLYSETLRTVVGIPDDAREYCDTISQEAQRLTRLIDDILQFSPASQGVKKYELSEGDMLQALVPTLERCRDYLRRKGFTLVLNVPAKLPSVRFDAEAVKSAVLNLIDNSVKYSGVSNRVLVTVTSTAASVTIAVKDDGIGIAPDQIEKIFEPYYRVEMGKSRSGCGLGLYLVKHIMAGHRGTVEVTSKLGEGSCFRLIFPVAQPEPIAKQQAQTASEWA